MYRSMRSGVVLLPGVIITPGLRVALAHPPPVFTFVVIFVKKDVEIDKIQCFLKQN
jgi:hypothetical protein